MGEAEDNFRKWFVDSLEPLSDHPNAGFIFAMIAFPLLERYLRNRSGCLDGEDLSEKFFDSLGENFPAIAAQRFEFWQCYRNGLLHRVTFPKERYKKRPKGIWVQLPSASFSGHDQRSIYVDEESGGFFLNPVKFFREVTAIILADFQVYEGTSDRYRLARIENPSTTQPRIVPTISGLGVKKDPE